MSIVSCDSCGMQYNAAGYKPGVQFKCTQCGAMVLIAGAPARGGTGRLPTGNMRRSLGGPMGNPAGARGEPGPNPFGPPQSKKNVGMMIALGGGGVVAVLLIIIVIVVTSGPDPQVAIREAAKAKFEEDRKKQQAEDEKRRIKNASMQTTYDAALGYGSKIESCVREGDRAGLEALFDWSAYAAYNAGLAAQSKQYLNSPLFSTGKYGWVKDDQGKELLKWQTESVHTAETLRKQCMDYLQTHLFSSPEVIWDRKSSEEATGGFGGVSAGGRTYMGKKIFLKVKGAGMPKEFWVGAPEGDSNVRIINLLDPSATKNMQDVAIDIERKASAGTDYGDDRGLGGGFEERRKREGGSTDRPRGDRDIPDADKPIEPAEVDLPAAAKLGVKPSDARLENILRSLVGGARLALAQKNSILSAAIAERKLMMGALIDALIDAQKAGKRLEKASLSAAMFEIWGNFARKAAFGEEDMTYVAEGHKQSDSDDVIRRWIKVYNDFK